MPVEELSLAVPRPGEQSGPAAAVRASTRDPGQTQLGVLLVSMLIAALVPILGSLIFQRTFLRGSGLGGALKG
jgi:ABC-type glycerol-3-phosphate transport system permease component